MKTTAQIAAELREYDPNALPVDVAHAFLQRLVAPVMGTERLPLTQALGRVLAEDVISPINVPPHDNSAMDGYAFHGAELSAVGGGQALTLRVVGTALAGARWQGTVGAGECVRIMTGAVMPAGLDTVVPQELVQIASPQLQDKHVTLFTDVVRCGDNRRLRGEDLQADHPALQQGQQLTPAALGLLASLGLTGVSVVRRLRVALFSTGDEILRPGEPPRDGAVYDSNRTALHGLLIQLGCDVIDLGVVKDQPEPLRAAFLQAAQQADAIITSGGVSTGDADHTRTLMAQLGDVAFWRLAIRPGRPMAVGRIPKTPAEAHRFTAASPEGESPPVESSKPGARKISGAVLFGLPGNPVAAMVSFITLVRPALRRMMGARAESPVLLRATCEQALRKKTGRTEYQRGIVTQHTDGRLTVRTTGSQGSGVLSSMVQANGLIVLGHDQGPVAKDDEVQVMLLSSTAN
ncbi:molybdopterin molybdotransferase MoeA [Ottowia sp.]|uniref:molybdopterin molybdotransferase MoeA n=1 Tax=Ottowia sp. TaxID=1898956 RepID=UPI003A8666D8